MPALGSDQRPIIVKVTSRDRAEKVASICKEHGFKYIVGIESDENLTDLKQAIRDKTAPKSTYDPCPCGSGTKYKFCCMKKDVLSGL